MSFCQYWERSIGEPDSFEYIDDFFESYDKGYVLGTILVDDISPNQQNYIQSGIIYKTDVNGNILWYRNLRKDQCALRGCKPVGDGTLVVLVVLRITDYKNKILLSRIDPCGNVMWCKEIIDGMDCGYGALDLEIIDHRIVFCREIFCNHLDSWFDIVMFNLEGNKICEKPFLFFSEHPLMNSPFLNNMLPLPNNEFMMLGRVYYKANPTSPAWLRALFIKFDAEGNEQWVLPFGLKDTLVSFSSNCENVVIPQLGRYFAFSCIYSNSEPLELLLMKFKDTGYENGYVISEIDSLFNIGYSPSFEGTEKINENKFLTQLGYQLPDDPNHVGYSEVTVDSTVSSFMDTLHLAGYHLHPMAMRKTFDGKYLTGGFDISYEDVQAYLNKVSLNPLEFDTMYTAPYTYDSLCPGITYADTIYFENCDVIPGNDDFIYDEFIRTPLSIYPNPTEKELTVSIVSPPRKESLEVIIYTLTGEIKWQGVLQPGEQSKWLSVFSWAKGVYFVILRKEDEILGREKVIVM